MAMLDMIAQLHCVGIYNLLERYRHAEMVVSVYHEILVNVFKPIQYSGKSIQVRREHPLDGQDLTAQCLYAHKVTLIRIVLIKNLHQVVKDAIDVLMEDIV
jgi:hypothetical protein